MDEIILVAAELQHFQVAGHIGAFVIEGMGQGVAHPGLSRQMDHTVNPGVGQSFGQSAALGQIEAQEGEAGFRLEPGQPGFLQRDVIIGIEIIDADDRLTSVQ